MIPESLTVIEQTNQGISPSLTYRLDFSNKRIIGKVEGDEAIFQAVHKVLSIDRYAFEIYNWLYGNELYKLIGAPYDYILSEIPRLMEEALLQDDRIKQVTNFVFNQLTSNSIEISFLVVSTKGTNTYAGVITL